MATIKCGRLIIDVKYRDIDDSYGTTDYTYSFRLFLGEHPLFSYGIEKDLLSEDGLIIATSDDEDMLLNMFRTIGDDSTPVGTDLSFYSEVDSPQQIIMHISKETIPNCPKLHQYALTVEIEDDSFLKTFGMPNIILKTKSMNPDFITNFVSEMEEEKIVFIEGHK